MGTERIVDMTVEELKGLIAQIVDERIRQGEQPQITVKKRSLHEIMDSVDRHRWTPPPGSPSVVEMIREDRDS
jgi:hypothetical protein